MALVLGRKLARRTPLLVLALLLTLGWSAAALAQVDVTASAGTPSASYLTLKEAFDAINAGTHQGVITIGLSGNTTETASAVLNASGSGSASYTSIGISPTGGAARTITGAIAAGSPLIDLSGADNVTIDGLNSGGNTLTIANTTASATTGTSTIRFINGATQNLVSRCAIQGSFSAAVATNGGNIYFATDASTTNGNDNNTISYCDIGPAGTNLPTKGVYVNGSTTSASYYNSGIVIDNNNIFDYFGTAVSSAGVYIGGGSTDINVTNNKFYQTATRTQTTGAQHSAIWIANSSGNNYQLVGNTIGYASSTQTGTYSFVGVSSSSVLIPIFLNVGTTTATSVQGNTIAGLAMSGAVSGTSSSAAFRGIYVSSGLAYIGATSAGASGVGNTIGSLSANGSITFTSSSSSAGDVLGMFNFGSSGWIVMNNNIGGITASNSSTGAANFYGIRYNTSGSVTTLVQNNTIGGSLANSIQSTTTATGTVVQGILATTSISTITGNTIRNLSSAGGTGTGTTPSVAGIVMGSSSVNNTVSQNTVHSLSNTNATTTGHITGIMYQGSTGTNLVNANLIHSLYAASASAVLNGIHINAGTSTYANNMIRLGIDASGAAITTGCAINGINETIAGTDNMYFNSVFIGGSGVGGSANTFAFQSSITTNTRNYVDNIFWNNRSNGAGTGKHYAIRVGGTAANPAGLTSNYNDLLADGTGGYVGLFNAIDQTTIASWRTATGQDGASFSGNPQFTAPNGTASTVDLHISPTSPTPIEGAGLAIAAVTTDFDGQTRAGLTPTDLGADAGNFVLADILAPVINLTAFGNTCSTSDRTLTATITDATGVPTAGIGLPVLYWKVNAGSYAPATAAHAGGSTYTFTFGAGVALGDVVSYYVVAQDTASPPNIGSLPAGASGFTADPPAAATPPGSPFTYSILSSLAAGTYAIPGSYASLTAAVADYNTKCMEGPIVFELAAGYSSAGETFPITINANGDASAVNTLTIRPAAGQTQTISGSLASGALLKLNGADWVIIDGSNSGGTDRNLTVTNTATTAPSAIWIASLGTGAGATNNVVKNCLVNTAAGTTTTAYGLALGGSTLGTAGGDNDNNTIQNNAFTSANIGIYAYGAAAVSAGGMDNLLVSGNSFAATSTLSTIYGIQVGAALNASITGNTLNLTTTATGQPVGISIETNSSNCSVTANQIQAVVTSASGGYGGRGITVGTGTTGSNITVANNFVAGVNGSNYSSFSNSSALGIGIGIVGNSGTLTTATGGVNIYHNSINMTGSMGSGSTSSITTALYIGSAASALNIRNNIIVNTQVGTSTTQKNYGVYSAAANTAFTAISYNDYYVSNSFNAASAILGYLGGDQTTLAAFNTAFTGNPNTPAFNVMPGYVSATDLHIPAATTTLLESGGAGGTGISVDVDNQARPGPPGSVNGGGTANDVGADEFDGTPLTNNDMAATAFVDPVNGGTKALGVAFDPKASFTNLGLAAQTAVTVRYRIVGPSPLTDEVYNQTATITSIASLATTTVTFPSVTINTGGTYAIYAAAELVGDQAPANDQITGAMTVLAPLAGSYTVGLALFNRVTGADLTFVPQVQKVVREMVEPVVEIPRSADGRALPEQVTWRTVTREVEETVWVPMSHGQKYDGPLSVFRDLEPNLPSDGGRGVYATLTAAVADLNGRGLSGPVEFLLVDATYPSETFPITFNVSTPATTPTNTVTVRPNTGVTATISGSMASSALIKFNGVDYVTIDGSNSGGTDRSLTLTNTATTAPCAVWISSLGNGAGATYDTVKNCVINTSAATASTAYGIAVSGSTISSAGGDNDYVSIQNNAITSANVGVYANGNAAVTTGGLDNLVVAGNAFTANTTLSTVYGVQLANALNASISGNSFNIATTAATAPVAISLEANVSSSSVTANQIQSVVTTATGGYAGRGITVGTGTASSAITIANNFIAGVNGSNWSTFGLSSAMGVAIGVVGNSSTLTTTAGGVNLYHNSINMTGSMGSGSTTAITAALYVGTGASALNIQNNIIVNSQVGTSTTQKNYGVYSAAANTVYTAISYNDYYVSNSFNASSAVLGYLGGDQTTLAAFNTAFTGNPSTPAFNLVPGFVSAIDLHIPAATTTLLESGGTAGTGITVDVDNQSRPGPPGSVNGGGTANDVGADEFDGTPVVDNDIAATAFVDPLNGGTKSVGIAFDPKASFSNLGLVDQTGVTVRYRIFGPSPSGTEVYNQTAVIASIASLTTTTVTFPSATLPAGGSYAIHASAELVGDQTPANDQITGAITALEPMAGTYTVGLALFNRAAGTELSFEPRVRTVMREVLEPVASPSSAKSRKAEGLPEQILWTTAQHEVEEVTWVAMSNGQPYERPLRVSRFENPDLPLETGRGVYPTITAAVADLNARGVAGPVTFLLTDATYPTETFPIVVNVTSAPPNALNPVTIKPGTGVISTVSGASAAGAILKVYNTNYVTIDGSNAASGTTRDLTLENTSATTPNVVWFGSNGTTPISNGSLRNCVVRNGSNSSSAVIISDGTTAGSAGYFANMEIRNNRIEKAYVGVYTNGGTTPANGSGLTLVQNELSTSGTSAIRHYGLYAQGVNGAVIANNEIGNFEATTGENDFGIWLASGTYNAIVNSNRIHDISYSGTSGYGPKGIALSTGVAAANVLISNNMISNLAGDGDSYSSYGCTYAPVGIYAYGATAQGGISIHDNSIYLYGNTLNYAADAYSVGIGFDDLAAGDVSGNNVVNNLGRLSTIGAGAVGIALETAATQLTGGNYNNYYCNATGGGTNNVGKIGSTDYVGLAAWQTASSRDANSISADPLFVGTANLHIRQDVISPVSNAGAVLAGVAADFDGDARSLTTPDIGADEFTIYTLTTSVVGPGSIDVAPLQQAYAPGTSVTLTAVPADSCQAFQSWSGDASGNANPLVVVMDSNKSITAAFGPAAPPAVTVTAPNGGESWSAGNSQDVTWTATSHLLGLTVDLEYSTDGGATYPNVIASGLPNSGTYSWLIPSTPTTQARVRVVVHDPCGRTGTDSSDADFTIQSGTDAVEDILLPGDALGVFPNPAASGNARVLYRLPAGTFSVDVYDVAGRLVRTLDSGTVAAGLRTVVWDGRDTNGTTMATGIYLVRLHTTTGLSATKRLILFQQ